jgi:urease accessory protein
MGTITITIADMGIAMSSSAARLWQLISPALPVGGFSYSQGLEQAVEVDVVNGESSAEAWIGGILRHGIAATDLPILRRVHTAWSEGDTVSATLWSDRLLAMRETAELRFEDRAMGGALARLLPTLGLVVPNHELSFAGAFAIAAAQCAVTGQETMAGYAWTWVEMQVAAAVKLIPLGHSSGQRLLWHLGAALDSVVDAACGHADDDIGMSLPGLAIMSARHETQYTRLFRS